MLGITPFADMVSSAGTIDNIPGNERADTAAKSALSLPITNIKLPASRWL